MPLGRILLPVLLPALPETAGEHPSVFLLFLISGMHRWNHKGDDVFGKLGSFHRWEGLHPMSHTGQGGKN